MAVSVPVRRYYAERIFARTGRDRQPPNFRPLEIPRTGFSTVEGCRGGGKNVLEVSLVGDAERVTDVRVSCGLCNPAMYVAADVLADWARGRAHREILATDATSVAALAPFFGALGGPGRPDDAREKFQYALLALQAAVRDHLGLPPVPPPDVPEPTDRDLDED